MREPEESTDKLAQYELMKAAGKLKREDLAPVYPHSQKRLFDVFWQLHRVRGSNGFSMNPITYHDIDAFMRLTATELSPWDIAQLREMDEVMMKATRISASRDAKIARGKAERAVRK